MLANHSISAGIAARRWNSGAVSARLLAIEPVWIAVEGFSSVLLMIEAKC